MATLTIRNLNPALKERLRVRAAQHGRSMEAELREILHDTLKEPEQLPPMDLYQRIRARFAPLGGVDLDLPPREPAPEPRRGGISTTLPEPRTAPSQGGTVLFPIIGPSLNI